MDVLVSTDVLVCTDSDIELSIVGFFLFACKIQNVKNSTKLEYLALKMLKILQGLGLVPVAATER